MKVTVLTEIDTESLESVVEKLTVLQSISSDSLMLIEDAVGMLLVHELRQLGIDIKAACLGHLEQRLIRAGKPINEVN